MTTFQDGPAAGQTLQLQRAPIYLRVTEEGGTFDALDQLHDEPKPTERLYCYVLAEVPGHCHVLRSPRHLSGWQTIAKYRFVDPQPTDDQMRATPAWRDWTNQQPNPFKT